MSIFHFPGSSFGLSLVINIEQYEYFLDTNVDAGIKVKICTFFHASVVVL